MRAIHGLFALGIKPKSRDEPTATVDAEGNNLFMGDGQKATNEGGRGLRTHNVVVDWLSHWFHVAGIKHKGGFRGRPASGAPRPGCESPTIAGTTVWRVLSAG